MAKSIRPEDLGIGKLFERIWDAIIVADAETQRIVLWNPAATDVFGYSASEALNKLCVEALVPEYLKAQHRAGMIRYAKTSHGPYIDSHELLKLPALRKDGEEIRIEMSLSPIGSFGEETDGGGSFVLAIVRDVTERNQVERALREAEELFRSAFDNASIGMTLSDLDGHYLRVNRALCDILGYSEEELQATMFQAITYPEDYDISMAYVDRILKGETNRYSLEKRYVRADGNPVWVSLNVSLVRDPEDCPCYFIAQVQDITERKQAEEEIKKANRRLSELAALRADFTTMVAHELGSPLAAIRGFLEVLATGALKPVEQADILDKIRAETDKLSTLVADVKSAAAIEREDFALMLRRTSVDELLEDAARFAETLPGDHPFVVEVEVEEWVWVDPYRIGQVLRNLLSNAAKYSPDGAPIELRASYSKSPGGLRIEVADRGPGVHSDDVERVFEKFGRGRIRSGRKAYGVGLGLYISRRIVRAHGGELSLDPAPGDGSIFGFELEIADGSRSAR